MKAASKSGALAGSIATLALAFATAAGAQQAGSPLVQTAEGPVIGTTTNGVSAFTHIPFAKPPVGELRFRAPQPVTPWTKPLVANQQIPNCTQFGGLNGAGGDENAPQSEDCLYLSVWSPKQATPAKPLPVMVWIYGGAFVVSGPRMYNGAQLSRNGVVVVTLNYRLGLFGQMVDPSLDRPEAKSGNYDIRDVQAALHWVQRNIKQFGGDPRNVTIFGQSAGGLATMFQVISPQSKGLFSKAIIQSTHSGAATERPTIANRADVVATQSPKVLAAVGCTDAADRAACLRAAPADKFVNSHIYMAHMQDAALLPNDMHEALATGNFNHVPMMIGNVTGEGAFYIEQNEREMGRPLSQADLPKQAHDFFGAAADKMMAAYPASQYGGRYDIALMHAITDYRLACAADSTRLAVAPYVPVYGYEMTEPDPEQEGPNRAYTRLPNIAHHASDLNFIFGGGVSGDFKTPRGQAFSKRYQTWWANFAKYGAPDPSGQAWPNFTAKHDVVMDLQEPPVLQTKFVEQHRCTFMRDNKFVRY